MINNILSVLRRPERGWDPIPSSCAEEYASQEWAQTDTALIDYIERRIDGFAGKRVLDIGGGPGQFAAAFALRRADVTWHDISRSYLDIARKRAHALGVSPQFSLGYLEDAESMLNSPFDLVFNRICYCYSKSDRQFASLLYRLTRPGGYLFIWNWLRSPADLRTLSVQRRLQHYLNAYCRIKVGHPCPPRSGVPRLLLRYDPEWMEVRYPNPSSELIFLKKR